MAEQICRWCGEFKNVSHHCSGRKAYQKGRDDLIKEQETQTQNGN
jgi:hypothetical protein